MTTTTKLLLLKQCVSQPHVMDTAMPVAVCTPTDQPDMALMQDATHLGKQGILWRTH